ncbi:ORF83 [Ranid herpesvirus 2]|uniref:ORF83 n=1 Tax=Ranid herpesvirus 2 TaxID=389214 RepID=Q14W23_9VIRU|nr:ORF83 [Ranid herpesvirus 2]ABG25612.1 ORF83 [Ranid herpesvirus 2]
MAFWKNYRVLYNHSAEQVEDCDRLIDALESIYRGMGDDRLQQLKASVPHFTKEEREALFVLLHNHTIGIDSVDSFHEKLKRSEAYRNSLKVCCDIGTALDITRDQLKASTRDAMACISACMTVLATAHSHEQHSAALWKMTEVCKMLTNSISFSSEFVDSVESNVYSPMDGSDLCAKTAQLAAHFEELQKMCGSESADASPPTPLQTVRGFLTPAPDTAQRNRQLKCLLEYVEEKVVKNVLKQLVNREPLTADIIAIAANLSANYALPRSVLADLLLERAPTREEYVTYHNLLHEAEKASVTPLPTEIGNLVKRELYFMRMLFEYLQDQPDVSYLPFQHPKLPKFFVYCANDIIKHKLCPYAQVMGAEVSALMLKEMEKKNVMPERLVIAEAQPPPVAPVYVPKKRGPTKRVCR